MQKFQENNVSFYDLSVYVVAMLHFGIVYMCVKNVANSQLYKMKRLEKIEKEDCLTVIARAYKQRKPTFPT